MPNIDSVTFNAGRPLLKEITAEKLNIITQQSKQNRIKGERGISVRQSGDYTFIGLATELKTTTQSDTHPFKINVFKDELNENQYVVNVMPGTLNGLLANNTYFNNKLTSHVLSGNTVKHVVMTATSDGTKFINAQIELQQNAPSSQTPEPWGLPDTVKFLIGTVYNSTAYQVIKNNITVIGKPQYQTEDATYFVWQ